MSNTMEHTVGKKRLGSLIAMDLRRMFTSRYFYILLGIALVIPVLVLVMTTMMDGSVSVDPNTGVETTVEAFDSVISKCRAAHTEPSVSFRRKIRQRRSMRACRPISRQKTAV